MDIQGVGNENIQEASNRCPLSHPSGLLLLRVLVEVKANSQALQICNSQGARQVVVPGATKPLEKKKEE